MKICACSDRICSVHFKTMHDDLELIAGSEGHTSLMYDLRVTITKMDKIGSSLPGGGDDRPMVYNVAASEAANEIISHLRRLAYWMIVEYPHLQPPEDNPVKIARWLLLVPELLREHSQCRAASTYIRAAVSVAVQAIDSPKDKKFLGACPYCKKALYISVDFEGQIPDEYVVCCGIETHARDLRDSLLDKVSDEIAPARRIVGIVNEITGLDISSDSIRAMKRKGRGELKVRGISDDRHHAELFRVGDVTDILTRRNAIAHDIMTRSDLQPNGDADA